MSESLTLTLPMPPNLANSRMHWRVKHKKRKAYFDHLTLLMKARGIPFPPHAPPPRVSLDSTLYLWAHMDDDNALARIKWAADWLRVNRYIVDDKRPHCAFTIPTQVIDRTDPRLVITIRPLAA